MPRIFEMDEEFDLEKARAEMREVLAYRMPFGKFKNQKLVDLPVEYLLWFKRKGIPEGKLGRYLQIVLEMKS
jgi:uncharacterized protein